MDAATRLSTDSLRWRCPTEQFAFQNSDELPDLDDIVGQSRSLESVQFGIAMKGEGYNIFALGPPGIGKRTVVQQCLAKRTGDETPPPDWCYVNNFDDIRRPKALQLPTGRGAALRKDVKALIEDLGNAINATLESDEHKSRVQDIEREADERERAPFQELAERALSQHIQLIRTPGGFALAPMNGEQVMSPEEYQKLSDEDKQKIHATIETLQNDLQRLVEQVPKSQAETRNRIRELNRDAVRLAIGHLLAKSKAQYQDLGQVVAYFEAMEQDILERVDEFQPSEDGQVAMFGAANPQKPSFDDYAINLLVDNSATSRAPVIYEDHPSYHNLIGRVEHESHMGALLTDFTLIKAGALHRANGGYLLLDALRLLQQPYAWEGLKRALTSRTVKLESLGESLSLISTVSLEPEPIPLDVKVVLLGDRSLYYALYQLDREFAELFRVSADFDEEMDRNPEQCQIMARLLATLARREKLRPLDVSAVARMLEHSARLADDAGKLTIRMRTLADVAREANYWAEHDGASMISANHVKRAVEQQIRRADRVRERIHEEINRGTILIDTSGAKIGQVNGLSVLDLGNIRFGQPSRITATARAGQGQVIDIERQAKLSGPIHSKGVMILTSFLAARFAQTRPLSLSVSLAFEQSYGMVEGDSASVAEWCALMSAIADVPLKQNFAVTGSINQLGQVQAIGGVNEKIEGYFDVCAARGLTGDQGVVIPKSNVRHLMLRDDVVEACDAGRFHVHAIETVDQSLELLSGIEVGNRNEGGEFPPESFNARVELRLRKLARRKRRNARSGRDRSQPENERKRAESDEKEGEQP